MNDPKQPAATAAHDPVESGPLTPGQVKALKAAIVIMAIMIVVGLFVIVGRMFYLAGRPKPPDSPRAVATPMAASRVALPAGATVRHVALDGDRLAIHYDSPAGSGIKVVQLSTGTEVSHIAIVPGVPAR